MIFLESLLGPQGHQRTWKNFDKMLREDPVAEIFESYLKERLARVESDKPFYSGKKVERILGVSRWTLGRMRADGRIEYEKNRDTGNIWYHRKHVKLCLFVKKALEELKALRKPARTDERKYLKGSLHRWYSVAPGLSSRVRTRT